MKPPHIASQIDAFKINIGKYGFFVQIVVVKNVLIIEIGVIYIYNQRIKVCLIIIVRRDCRIRIGLIIKRITKMDNMIFGHMKNIRHFKTV